MGVLSEEMKWLKCDITLFIDLTSIGPYSRLSNEVIGIDAAQGVANVQEVKFWGPKKLS